MEILAESGGIAKSKPSWIPLSKTLPKHGQKVVVLSRNGVLEDRNKPFSRGAGFYYFSVFLEKRLLERCLLYSKPIRRGPRMFFRFSDMRGPGDSLRVREVKVTEFSHWFPMIDFDGKELFSND